MKKIKLAGITIGQSPRVDITGDILPLFSPNIELVEYGALDPYSLDEVEKLFGPQEGEDLLVSRMQDGRQVKLGEKHIFPLIQQCIHKAEADGVDGIILLCTGAFEKLEHGVLLIVPQPLLHSTAAKLAGDGKVGVMVPDAAQVEQVRMWWQNNGVQTEIVPASPYLGLAGVATAAGELKGRDVALVCLDCMGYTVQMKQLVAEVTGKPVLLPRTLIARVAEELWGER